MQGRRALHLLLSGALLGLTLVLSLHPEAVAETSSLPEWTLQKLWESPLPLDPDFFAVYRTVVLKGDRLLVVDNDLDLTHSEVVLYRNGQQASRFSFSKALGLPAPMTVVAADVCPDGLVFVAGRRVFRTDEAGRSVREWEIPNGFHPAPRVVCTADGVFVAYGVAGLLEIRLYSLQGTLLRSFPSIPLDQISTGNQIYLSLWGFPNYAGKAIISVPGKWWVVSAQTGDWTPAGPSEEFRKAVGDLSIRGLAPVIWQGREALLVRVARVQRLPLEEYIQRYSVPPDRAQDLRDLFQAKKDPHPTVPVSSDHQLWVLDLWGRPLARVTYTRDVDFPVTTDAVGSRWIVLQEPFWPPQKHRYILRAFALGSVL
jgi:hypothetical protein